MTTLVLVDGSSYLYRAYHALPDLRNRRGEPTGAIFGVLNMLRKLLAEYKPEFSACVFDAKGPTFRDAWYPAYKATRTPMPPELAAQIEPLHEAIRALGWPLLCVPGVEADDVIGTLSRRAEQAGIATVISTGDKDMVQLLSPHVRIINTMTNEGLDPAAAEQKYGLPPERFIDYLTLIGDVVDNVPGVAKVGPKTAVKWLQQFGSLDAIMAAAADIGGVVGQNLRDALDWLPTARRLITIRCDLTLDVEPDHLFHRDPDPAAFTALVERYELKSWLRDAPRHDPGTSAGAAADPPAAPPSAHDAHALAVSGAYRTVLDEEQLAQWLERINAAALTCIDTETTSLDPMQAQLVGISLAVEAGQAVYIPLAHHYAGVPAQLDRSTVLAHLRAWLEDPAHRKVGQHLKYDSHVFANHGIRLRGIAEDTLLQSYVLESHRTHDMDSLARRHLGASTIPFEAVAGKGVHQLGFDQVDIERAAEYAAEDADITLQLHQVLRPQLAAEPALERVYREIELPAAEVLWRMERNGVSIDAALLDVQSAELGRKMLEAEAQAHAAAGRPFNLGSTKQLQELLFQEQGLRVIKKTPGGAPSTDEDVLQELALDHPLPKKILEYRGLQKLKSTYTDKLPRMVNPRTGRVHTHYAQAVAVTGRLSSSDPNLQNIPVRTAEGRRIREAFVAPAGSRIVSADYSQIELRIMAHLSGDSGLLEAFARGEDVHRATAAEIFSVPREDVAADQRRVAKVINFGLIYGMSAFGLAQNLNIERHAAQSYIDRYFARYPGVAAYMERTRAQARAQGYVETVFGRRLWLPEISSGSPGRRQAAERAAINAPMQGTAADLIKRAMISVQAWLDGHAPRTLLIMQVHDELVLEVPEPELERVHEALPRLMCGVAELAVPLQVEMGTGANWDEAH
ncbi:MAG: DNA polymerase I [Pseudomonadota bacterium]|nr:DNA polymerase I [Pseudomonadota bacterium]